MNKRLRNFLAAAVLLSPLCSFAALPQLIETNGQTQLLVDEKPFLILGGELGNSSASSLEYMDDVWLKASAMNINTLLVPVYWELLEPVEGRFDFDLLEGLIERAREQEIKLVLLWFGSWKNSMSCYVPSWVKRDSERFPRAFSADGKPQEILTPFSPANLQADQKAFAAMMQFLEKTDRRHNTVLMVQVENEIGMLPSARDHHPLAETAFKAPVPQPLMQYLQQRGDDLEPELRALWSNSNFRSNGSWEEVFGTGKAAEEVFIAWHFARYADGVAGAGKAEYELPMFVNAALNRPGKEPGEYPSGGPLPHLMDVWKAGAPNIDLLVPDFYNPRFQYWNDRYTRQGDPLLIPEIRFDPDVGAKALYAFGHYNTLGFSPFSVETGSDQAMISLAHSYNLLHQVHTGITNSELPRAGVWLSKENPQMQFTLGDYQFTARHELTLGWSPGASEETWPEAGAAIIQTGDEEFIVAGTGVVLTFDHPEGRAGIDTIREGQFINGSWYPGRVLNGDQSHQGRHLRIADGSWEVQLLKLYRY
ncbi:DUF5597 domain-containing protein [Microbulbifer bruguierae]|uniref:DUF5597 domain-containing protein n=1 Tax=Microbulbifer bruguierae TaxID=3029061 RepID=A0ABY8NHG4_9GAMM|nr:DUF5597 domain-containing protein [Microbulbifer bruguierae]WGL18366.1 DUF5597 domain-containing protein [Microbulbifer bruguierae]